MELERLLGDARMLQAVLGTSHAEIKALVPVLEVAWQQQLAQRPNRQRAVGAGAKGKLAGAERKLCFILFYLKVYPTFDVLSFFFHLDRSECCRWVHKLLPVLEQVLGRHLVLPKRQITSLAEFAAAFPGATEVLVDGMERPIQRPKQASPNRKHYSGKKKRHTRKAMVVADARRVIQGLPATSSVIADAAFQGSQHPQLCLPRKGSKNHPLSTENRGWNRLVASIRVRVEHAIGGRKRFGAGANLYRNHKPCCDDRFNLLAAGLWNLRLALRTT